MGPWHGQGPKNRQKVPKDSQYNQFRGKNVKFINKSAFKAEQWACIHCNLSIFNRGLNPNTLQVFKKMFGSPYKARGLIVVGTDEI